MRYSKTDHQMLARCIQEIEARSQTEVVLVLHRCSGLYRDVDYLFGALCGLVVLGIELLGPWEFHPLSLPLPLILTFALAARGSHKLGRYGPRRYLTSEKRRHQQVRHAAYASFREKKVAQTQNRIGILLYFSALEQMAELVPDEAAAKALAPRLSELTQTLRLVCSEPRTIAASVQGLAEYLRHLGLYLGQVLPYDPSQGPRQNELDDTPDLEDEKDES
jgi:uncharacterized membrane protein